MPTPPCGEGLLGVASQPKEVGVLGALWAAKPELSNSKVYFICTI
jgi:hypothetical protein